MPADMPADTELMLTDTELTTLAVMLDSATRHMTSARTEDDRYVWAEQFCDAVADVQWFFYKLQVDQNSAAGMWNKELVKLSA